MAAGFRCSDASAARNDSMVATAPPARSWLLVEHEGAWPVTALQVLPPGARRALAARAADHEARISLIRRPGRHPREDGPIRWAFADVRPGHEGIRWGMADSPADLIDMQWSADAGEGDPVAIVCAHSRHDVCCAVRGRPVAAALAGLWPGQVWECSHLGGDRFAATMVLLPHGLCYGRVTPATGPGILQAFDEARVIGEHLRGRCSDDRITQAAQALVRAAMPERDRIDDLRPLATAQLADDIHQVELGGEPVLSVQLRERLVALGTPATCRSSLPAEGREYDLLTLTAH